MRYAARAYNAAIARLFKPKKTDDLVVVQAPEFTPSYALLGQMRRARALRRNLEHASIYNPRLARRAIEARDRVRAQYAHERRAFEEANA